MKRLARWVGLAAFCAAFGFLGSLAAVQVMASDLQGEPGQPGPQGALGEPGLMGPPGPSANLSDAEAALIELDDRVWALEDRADILEIATRTVRDTPLPTPRPVCIRYMDVVTGVSISTYRYAESELVVDKARICADTIP